MITVTLFNFMHLIQLILKQLSLHQLFFFSEKLVKVFDEALWHRKGSGKSQIVTRINTPFCWVGPSSSKHAVGQSQFLSKAVGPL